MPSFDIESLLNSETGPAFRAEIVPWIEHLIPAEMLVPDVYQRWRPLVRDAISFIFSRLSPARLATKISEQLRLPPDATPEVRLTHFISRMPGLQKLGQVLARNHHLDPALRRELATLENGIRDVEFNEIHGVIERELGSVLPAVSVRIEPRIFSEASVSAVVRFTYSGGHGIFKVLKPHIPDCFVEDMALLQELADFIASGARDYGFAGINVAETFTEIRRLLEHEVKFEYEQKNLLEAVRVFERPGIRIPRIIPELCTPLITAMTEESGVKATDLPDSTGVLRSQIAQRLVEALLITPLFSASEESLFHADPHAGNLLYDDKLDRLTVLDWALTGHLSRSQRRQICMLLAMLALRDVEGVDAAIHALSEECGSIRHAVSNFVASIPISRVPGTLDAIHLLDVLALEGIRFPVQLVMFRKTLFTLDGVLRDITGGEVSLDAVIAGFLVSRWLADPGTSPLPLGPNEWASLMASVSLYGSRFWFNRLRVYGFMR